jgi:hypothetical protein
VTLKINQTLKKKDTEHEDRGIKTSNRELREAGRGDSAYTPSYLGGRDAGSRFEASLGLGGIWQTPSQSTRWVW